MDVTAPFLEVSEESAAYADDKVGPVVLLCTGVVVVLTLAVNGTTTAGLLQWLGLTRPEVSVQVAVRKARRHIREQCLAVYHEHLTTSDDVMGTADFRSVSELVPFLAAVEEEETALNGVNGGVNGGLSRNNASAMNRNGGGGGGGGGGGRTATTTATHGGGAAGPGQHEDSSVSSAGTGGGGAGSGGEGIELQANNTLAANRQGLMTPAPSIADLAAFGQHAEQHEAGAGAAAAAAAAAAGKVKNVLGNFDSGPDLAAAVAVAVKKDFDEMVAVWQRDVRGRFLAHLKVLYWEALEVGRATKEIVETLVECTDIALDRLDAPLGDWRALETHMLVKAQSGRPWWKRAFHALPPTLRKGLRWVQQWVLHSGAHPGGGARRRALVAVALFHDAHQEACHAIFGEAHHQPLQPPQNPLNQQNQQQNQQQHGTSTMPSEHNAAMFDATLDYADTEDEEMSNPAATAAKIVRAESEGEKNAAKSYLRGARTNEPELAAAVKSEETARRLLAVAERSAKGYVQSGLLTAVEAEELLAAGPSVYSNHV